jgi:RimJ/RimL family protein N-acetyltransferase
MKLETDRLILRRFRPEDTDAMVAINADPQVMECFPSTMSREETLAHLARVKAHWTENNFGLFAVEIRDTGQMIGFTGLSIPPYETPATPCVEVGWRMTPTAWGKGYATEAATACLNWGFNEIDLNEIVSFTFEGNTRSRRVMERLGMTHNTQDDFDHIMLPADSPLLRHVLYRLVQPDT